MTVAACQQQVLLSKSGVCLFDTMHMWKTVLFLSQTVNEFFTLDLLDINNNINNRSMWM